MNAPRLLTDTQVREFIVNGFITLQPDVAPEVHAEVHKMLEFSFEHESWLGNNIVSRIPRMHDVLRSSVVHGAVTSIAGPDYYLHPHRAIHRNMPLEDNTLTFAADVNAPQMGKGSNSGSGWHQDAQSPLSRARHHVPRYVIGFYFPHDTPRAMGPTRMQAGSYLYAHPVEPRAVVLPEHIEAGTFMLVHFDMSHAGFPNLADAARFMVKFVFTRTRHPQTPAWDSHSNVWQRPESTIPDFDLPETWGYLWHWLRGDQGHASSPSQPSHLADLNSKDQIARLHAIYGVGDSTPLTELADLLTATAGHDKHNRALAADKDGNVLPRDAADSTARRWNERAVVMEDATYALAVVGPRAVPLLTTLLSQSDPWVQINAVFALGEIGPAARDSVADISCLLTSPLQQVVRQALDALGAIGCGLGSALPAIRDLMDGGNPTWQTAQVGRGWTGEDQVQVNAMFTLLNAVNTGENLAEIESILTDFGITSSNGYVSAVAAEALVRIGSVTSQSAAIQYLSDRRWDESLRTTQKPF